ncbi:MAG: OadG family protein [Eubacterium sp.]|nr:OadG family protein [Eubacterium sp.]
MKKKLCLIVSLCLLLLGVAACGEDPKKMDYNGKSYDDLKSTSENLASSLPEFTDEQIDEGIAYYEQYGDTVIVGLMKQWKEIKADVGEFVSLGEMSVEKSGKTLTTAQLMDFTGRDLTLTCVYNYLDMQITSVTLDENYSLGEKMQKAAMNTLMGLGTVFMILILISLVIYGFKVIPYLQEKAKAKNAPVQEAAPVQPQAPVPVVQEEAPKQDDGELIAVIAAAIAASEGALAADGFVVRSIKRRK